MGLHRDEWIIKDGERHYLVTCDEILPSHHPRSGQVCGNRRYLRLSSAVKVQCCFQCSQRRKGKLGYKAALKTLRRKGYDTLPQEYLDKNPSSAEVVAANFLDRHRIPYQRNVRLPNIKRHWLIDFCIAGKTWIEIDCVWTHAGRKQSDAEKDRVAAENGVVIHRIPVPSGRLSSRDICVLENRLREILEEFHHV